MRGEGLGEAGERLSRWGKSLCDCEKYQGLGAHKFSNH